MARKGTLTVRLIGDSGHLTKTLSGVTGNIGGFVKAATKAGAVAAAAFGAVSVKSFASFDEAMTKSLAIMGDVSDEMRTGMSAAAREVAKTTQFSAAQAAESYFFLASAGLDAAQSIEALPKVAAFAQAGAFDMATATDLLTDAQSALGLAADDAQENLLNMSRVGDVLVKANTLANASVEQFSAALTQKAGAALRNLGKEVEEGAAVLGVFADQGVKGEQAGVALNSVLEGLTRTARTNASAYAELGVDVFDAQGEMRNMADIIGDLEGAFDGMSTEQRDAQIAQLGLTRTARDGIVQLLGSADAIREYEGALRDASGTVDDVAGRQMEAFTAQVGLLKDRFLDLAISAGSVLVPKLLTVGQAAGQIIDVLFRGDFTGGPFAEDSPFIASLFRVRDIALDVGPKVIAKIREVGQAVGTWWTETAQPKVVEFATAVRAFWTNTVKPVLAELQQAWEENGDEISQIATHLGEVIRTLGRIVGQVFSGAESDVQEGTEGISDDLGTIIGLVEQFTSALSGVARAAELGVQPVVRMFRSIAERMNPLHGAIEAFRTWRGVIDRLRESFESIPAATRGIFDGLTSSFRDAVNPIIDGWNRLSFSLPSVNVPGLGKVGGFTLNTPNIPRLAQGGMFEANSPTLAVVGDNRTQREITSPEDLMRRIVREESGGDTNVTIQATTNASPADISRDLLWTLRTA